MCTARNGTTSDDSFLAKRQGPSFWQNLTAVQQKQEEVKTTTCVKNSGDIRVRFAAVRSYRTIDWTVKVLGLRLVRKVVNFRYLKRIIFVINSAREFFVLF